MTVPEISLPSRTLIKDPSGIWRPSNEGSKSAERPLSYPDGGHDRCFALEDDSFWFQHRNECIFQALSHEPFDGPLLDIGGGNGVVASSLLRRGIQTVLLEPGIEGARNARARGVTNVVCATLDQAGFDAHAFGAAGLFDVIEHVDDDTALLRSVHRVLRRGGQLCVTVPAHSWLWSSEDIHAGHFRRYSESRLRTVLGAASFTIRFATYFFAPLVVPIFALRSLRHWLRPQSPMEIKASAQGAHVPSANVRRLMRMLLDPEAQRIANRRRIPLGTSLLVVAVAR